MQKQKIKKFLSPVLVGLILKIDQKHGILQIKQLLKKNVSKRN